MREKCPNTEFFLVRIFLYSVRIQENKDQKNSVFRHFSRSGAFVNDLESDGITCSIFLKFSLNRFNNKKLKLNSKEKPKRTYSL